MSGRALGVALAVPGLVVIGLLTGSLLAPSGGTRTVAGARAGAHARGSVPTAVASTSRASFAQAIVANARRTEVPVYRAPRRPSPWRRYSNPTAQGTPLVFLVRESRGSWLRVMLPSRPNGSEGWIRADDVELRSNPYSVLVDLRHRRLAVRDARRLVLEAAIGVGRAATPTPSGLYYIAELLRQPDPRRLYGPWAFALSAHSPVLSHFGGGDGQVGIHGTDEPAAIGHTVSHGCIRVLNRVIDRLAAILPLGTPVRILANAT